MDQNEFISMNRIAGRDIIISYPNFSEYFIIHTDASKTQLEEIISQNGHPVSFYLHKLTPVKINHTTTERELLSIVETLKELYIII